MPLQGLAARLRAARAAADLTQVAVAAVFGYTPPTIANWERARTEPSLADVGRLATLYCVSCDWLLTGRARLPHRFGRERCEHGKPITDRCMPCEATT